MGIKFMPWELVGNEWASQLLARHVARGEQRQAYLLAGPPGIGRRTLARRFAQALNCTQPPAPGEPCGDCRACRQIERMQYPDLFVVERQPDKTELLIDQVRALQHNLSLRPFEGAFRIGLILRAQEANLNAANALLKTLEEAPSQAILILTADSTESLLPTIVSRCETLRLRSLSPERLAKELAARRGLDPRRARLLAHLSSGRFGYALRLEDDPRLLEQREEWLAGLHTMLAAPRRARFAAAERLCRDKEIFRAALETYLCYWRDLLLVTTGADTPLVNLDREAELRDLADRLTPADARLLIQETRTALTRLDANVNARLLAEVLSLGWPRV
jgi:DNA polymerase III subunit delta'